MTKNTCKVSEARAYNALIAARRMGHAVNSKVYRKLTKRWDRVVAVCKAQGHLR